MTKTTREIGFNELSYHMQILILIILILTLTNTATFIFSTPTKVDFNQLNNSVAHKICWNETKVVNYEFNQTSLPCYRPPCNSIIICEDGFDIKDYCPDVDTMLICATYDLIHNVVRNNAKSSCMIKEQKEVCKIE